MSTRRSTRKREARKLFSAGSVQKPSVPKKKNTKKVSVAKKMEDLCDCNIKECPGCFYPCESCQSTKCGHICRVNRNWRYSKWVLDGGDDDNGDPREKVYDLEDLLEGSSDDDDDDLEEEEDNLDFSSDKSFAGNDDCPNSSDLEEEEDIDLDEVVYKRFGKVNVDEQENKNKLKPKDQNAESKIKECNVDAISKSIDKLSHNEKEKKTNKVTFMEVDKIETPKKGKEKDNVLMIKVDKQEKEKSGSITEKVLNMKVQEKQKEVLDVKQNKKKGGK